MDEYTQLLSRKALLDFYSGLSEDDKRVFVRYFFCSNGIFNCNSAHLINETSNSMPTQLDRIEQAVTQRGRFIKGVGENVIGNAIYDIAIALGKSLLKNIRL